MDNNIKKKFDFKDDVIDAANKKALETGIGSSRDNREAFEQIKNNPINTDIPSSNTQKSEIKIKNLRTFQGDVAEAIKNQNESILTITMAEEAKKNRNNNQSQTRIEDPEKDSKASILERITGKKPEQRPIPLNPVLAPTIKVEAKQIQTPIENAYVGNTLIKSSPRKKIDRDFYKNSLTIIFSIVLIILGIGAVGGFYYLQKKSLVISTPNPVDRTTISFNKKETIPTENLTRDTLEKKIIEYRNNNTLNNGSILYLALTKKIDGSEFPINSKELFTVLNTEAPESLLRSFGNTFMLGMYKMDSSEPFLLIELSSFANAFDGMLKWEKTINKDLGSIFSNRSISITSHTTEIPESPITSTTTLKTVSETRVVNSDLLGVSVFEDITFKNKDARVLKNTRGETILLYSFLDPKTVLITSSEKVLHEIINKLISEKLVR